jgi:uncharacterized protein (DUF2235 family)
MTPLVDSNGTSRVSYYTKGVGTSRGAVLSGGLFGYGINEIITSAYDWLIAEYNENDDLFIFGFSRGAYAARSLAGLITKSGIVRPGSPLGVGELYDRYHASDARTIYQLVADQDAGKLGAISTEESWLLKYSGLAPITMLGVWDTVGALVGKYSFLETGLRLSVSNAYHALAIDEHRKTFSPTLYAQNFHLDRQASEQPKLRDLKSVEQRWFVGAHANVGGGYNSDLLAQIPLRWLKRKAETHGMEFSFELSESDESVAASISNSFREMSFGLYYCLRLGRPFYRTIGALPVTQNNTRTVTVNETIDRSVFERIRKVADYEPRNLAEWSHP